MLSAYKSVKEFCPESVLISSVRQIIERKKSSPVNLEKFS
jgi:hypothetical protein